MNTQCAVIRDILPLYVDDACSAESREMIEAHLKECPDCAKYLEEIRASEAEEELKEEKELVIRRQARRIKRRTTAVGGAVSAAFMVPILLLMVINITSNRTLDWLLIVAAGMLVAAALIVVPVMAPRDKLFWTFCAFCVSLVILLAVCCLYTRGNWFFVASSASLFGLSAVFLPFVIRAKPLQKFVEGRNKALLVLAADGILFGNMMVVIGMHRKGFGFTMLMALIAVTVIGLLVAGGIVGKKKD